jgi:competence protein ComEA
MRAHLARMPTPGERRALIFIASVAALGVAVRGWHEFHPQDSTALAGNRTALARQIEAVDSAISVTSSKRKPRASRADTARSAPSQRPPRGRAQRPPTAPSDQPPRDPRQAYWDRIARADSVRQMQEGTERRTALRRLSSNPPSARRPPSPEKWTLPPVDLDIASIDEVAAIPFIGPAVARRIVTDRIENGPFGSIDGLARVPGITDAFAKRLAPFVTFSRAPRLGSEGERRLRSKSVRRPEGDSRP